MTGKDMPRLRQVRVRALGTSATVWAVLFAGSAYAQCAPEPTVANGDTTCTGVDADGLRVSTYGTRVTVSKQAIVRGSGGPAIAVQITSADRYGTPVTVSVAGTVDGGPNAGLSLVAQPNGYYNQSLTLAVAEGGSVTGANGVVVGRASNQVYSSADAVIDNRGTIAGTGGIALLSTDPGYAGFSSITNRATGSIGAIVGPVGALDNLGTIDGGSRSAIDFGGSTRLFGGVANSGTIRATSTAATLAGVPSYRTLTNSGTIENRGSGAAIAGQGSLSLTNAAGGRIASAGSIAISAGERLSLTNAGTIVGDVTAAGSSSYSGSEIDSIAGRITGAVRLGAGADTLIARYDGTRLQYGIDGAIDGGGGIDTVRARFTADAILGAPLVLPTAFERLSLTPAAGATVSIAPGFVAPGTLLVAGDGAIVNRAALAGVGQIIVSDFQAAGALSITNAGSITATGGTAGAFAVALNGLNRFENSGTITADRDAVAVDGRVVNSGTITAGGTALSVFATAFTNTASGVIRSTGGLGLLLSGSLDTGSSNAGRIEGVTAARLSTTLANSGVIAGTQTGVLLNTYGILDNRAGATVSGGTVAITARYPNASFFSSSTAVANAGTITGDVVLGDAQQLTYSNNNRFFALPGGTLNGNLALGQGDLLVTELAGTEAGRFAGITGNVTASNATLRLRVRQDASTTLIAPAGFADVGYELLNDPALTLTGSGTGRSLTLAGRGSVDLTANIAVTTTPAIRSAALSLAPGETATATALAITSRGALTLTRTDANTYPYAAVVLGGDDRFTNAGTITVSDRAATIYSPIAAIAGTYSFNGNSNTPTAITNSGTITLDGATGITGAFTLVNSGSIVQATGGRAATGIQVGGGYQSTVTNSGTIDVAGVAVKSDYGAITIDNSGRIASSGDIAIVAPNAYNVTINNAAGGTIAGRAGGTAIRLGGGTLSNAGTITGNVDLGYSSYGGRSYANGTYIADGGTIAGSLLFGSGSDTLVTFGALGVSGRIEGGDGFDTLIQARRASDTVSVDFTGVNNFEAFGVRALGADTVVTVRADAPVAGDLSLSGDGAVVNTAKISGEARVDNQGGFVGGVYQPGPVLAGFTNQGEIAGGFSGETRRFANSGTIGSAALQSNAVSVFAPDTITFSNDGRIANGDDDPAVSLESYGGREIIASNAGTITGGLSAYVSRDYYSVGDVPGVATSVSFANSGSVTAAGSDGGTVQLVAQLRPDDTGAISLNNSGTIEATGPTGIAAGLAFYGASDGSANRLVVANSGVLRANGGGYKDAASDPYAGASIAYPQTYPAVALGLYAGGNGQAQVVNAVSGTIEATGEQSVAIAMLGGALDLANAGTIRGGTGTTLTADDQLGYVIGRPYLAGAVQAGDGADRIVNTGSIIGSIDLGAGADRIENYGRIDGNVFLRDGDDTFLQRASATLVGTVDAGAGNDQFIVDATGGGAVNGDQFVNFERFMQIGEGNVAYSGNFRFNTVDVMGGTVTVASGQTLTSDGPVTITGSSAAETVVNDGTITGGISLDGGNDRVVNRGAIGGAVLLGDGDDSFVEGPGSRVAGGVDGGAGTDTYVALLAGDRSGLGAHSNFERLGVEGNGTLSLTLDQTFEAVNLTGAGLNVALNGFTIGRVTGSDAADRLAVDGDVATASFAAGDDMLSLGTIRAAGRYDGGAGFDLLRFAAGAPVTLTGSATGFEQVALAGGALTVAGTLGSAGAPLTFGDGAQTLTIAAGGTLAGVIDLGAGNDVLRLAAGSTLAGTVAGGAGTDAATIELAGDRALGAGALTGFETLTTEGRGTLTLAGANTYDRVSAATDLAVAADASLGAGQVRFAAGDQRFTIAGRFVGSVDGGAGSDTIALAGGSAAAPVAFTDVTAIEALAQSGGYATVSGRAAFGAIDLSGGRLVGLAGSTIGANQIVVRQGATFGSAGTVTGNLSVAGTLSPGASPGTMTVNGNVALGATSLSVFELTPTAQDKLVINGALAIAQGATLQLVPSGSLRPGTSYDLITASGGITGSFTTILKPDSLFGFVVQRADRIQLLGQFLGDPQFSPQVSRSIAYANATLAAQPANSPLFAALPALLTAGGASNPQAFAQLTPEPYASATQLGVENALSLADTARGPAFATGRGEPGAFTFAQALGSWYRLGGDAAQGSAMARTSSYGFLGGVGYGDRDWSVGAFGGYLDSRQRIATLGATTGADGFVAGVHGRYEAGRFGFGASIAYNGANGTTTRALPGATTARGRYDLSSWVSDLSVSYAFDMGTGWTLRPRVGVTYLRTTRDGVAESGGAFALTVARDRHVAGFADAGIGFGRRESSDAAFRPFVGLGVRYQLEGRRVDALGGYAGGGFGLEAVGAARTRAVGTANAGLAYRVTPGLDLFSTVSAQTGRDDHREAISTGVRLRF